MQRKSQRIEQRIHRSQVKPRTTAWRLLAALLAIVWLAGSLVNGQAAQAGDEATRARPAVAPAGQFDDGSYPSSLVYGPQGAYWFTLLKSNQAASFTPPSTIQTFPVPTAASQPFDITIGPDRALWFTEQLGNKIARLDSAGSLTELPLATTGAYPSQIVVGQEGGLWFTELEGNKIGHVAAGSIITETALPNPLSKPLGIAIALDGNVWFTEWNGYRIGKLTPQGVLAEYPISNPPSRPTEIVLGPDGNLWFVFEIGKKVTRVDASTGQMTAFDLATQNNTLTDLAIGPDGKLWFLGELAIGSFDVQPAGPANLQETAITPVFEGQGRSQLIAGPGTEMVFITSNSQEIYTASFPQADLRDLQLFITSMPSVLLSGGEFELQGEVVNWSASPATGVELDLTLDSLVQFVSTDIPGAVCNPSAGHVICQVADLPGGGSLPFKITLQTLPGGDDPLGQQLALEVRSAGGDYLPANNRAIWFRNAQRSFDYFTDFSAGADPYWSHAATTHTSGGLTYLGPFTNDLVKLTFQDLPFHDQARFCFDLYILGPWDGSQVVEPGSSYPPLLIGPDIWVNYMDLERLTSATFSNRQGLPQSYPNQYPSISHPAQAAALEVGDFGGGAGPTDGRYRICQLKDHTSHTLALTFYGVNLALDKSEGWALDNVEVHIFYRAAYDWIFMPLMKK